MTAFFFVNYLKPFSRFRKNWQKQNTYTNLYSTALLDIAIILCLCKAKNLIIVLAMIRFFNEADAQNNQFISGVLVLYWYYTLNF
jgi:hypothetical protein